jgi:hypothetical protein
MTTRKTNPMMKREGKFMSEHTTQRSITRGVYRTQPEGNTT